MIFAYNLGQSLSHRHGTDLANSAKINAMFIAIAFTMNMAYNSKRGTTATAIPDVCL